MNPGANLDHRQTMTRHRVSLSILLTLTSILVSVLFAELTLRVAGITYPSLYTSDKNLGAALRPNATGLWRTEGRAYVQINSDGLRDVEHTLAKPVNTLRIAVLGDSFAEAFQIKPKDAFWSVLKDELQSCPAMKGRNIEVINFGVSGYGTAQELIMLRTRVWKYDPDLILLAFLTGNDFRDNSLAFSRDSGRPYFVINDGRLVLLAPQAHMQRGAFFSFLIDTGLFDNSYFIQTLYHFQRALRHPDEMKAATDPAAAGTQLEPGLDTWIYLPPVTPDQHAAWQVTEKLIEQMYGEVREHGAGFLLATLSNGIQVHPDPEVRNAFIRDHRITDIFYPDHRIAILAERNHIPHVMLAPDLQRWAVEHNSCVHGFSNATLCGGHWNQSGHHLAGKILATELCHQLGEDSRNTHKAQH